jgi:hypothetical protein
MNDLSAIGPSDLNALYSNSNSSALAALGLGASGSFNSLVDQMLANPSTTTQQKAQLAMAQAKNDDNLALSGMFSDPSSSLLGSGLTGLLGGGGDLFGLPSWASQAASLSGDSNLEALLNMYNQEASMIQSQLLGGDGSSDLFDGLA